MKLAKLACFGMLFSTQACVEILEKESKFYDPKPVLEEEGSAAQGEDPGLESQWHLERIGAKGIPTNGSGNVKVGVLSSGVDYNHTDLRGRIWVNQRELQGIDVANDEWRDGKDNDGNGLVDDFLGYDVTDGDGLPYDRDGVGTAAAGIIAANANNGQGGRGVAPQVKLVPVQYIDQYGATSPLYLVEALQAVLKLDVDVIFIHTLSFEGLKDFEELALIAEFEKIAEKDIPVVFGVSNFGQYANKSLEAKLAKMRNVFIVAGSDEKDRKTFLSGSDPVKVITTAPASNLYTTWKNNSYKTVSGTAYAAAQVAGAIALAQSQQGNIQTSDLRIALSSNLGTDAVDQLALVSLSGGRLNVAKFLKAL